MNRYPGRLRGSLYALSFLAFLAFSFLLAALFTQWLFGWVGWHLPGLLVQVISSILGLVLLFSIASGFSWFFRSRIQSQQTGAFSQIIRALEQIAKGNFSTRIDYPLEGRENQLYGQLTSSVNAMAEDLSQMEQMRQEFISNVSHEIQSPLTSIRGFAEALEADDLSAAERHHYLEIIENESTRLSRITENLLRLAALESDKVHFEPRPYRLDKQVRSLVLACEPQWSAKALDLDVALDEVEVFADEDLLSQVWINLIHNAIKFTPGGGKISISLQRQGELVIFSIADTGIGISAEAQAHIFERFYKADASRTHSVEGSGLGLSIVQKIVALHQGSIAVESQVGMGSTFTVRLPLRQVISAVRAA